jgi:hypothetical protein
LVIVQIPYIASSPETPLVIPVADSQPADVSRTVIDLSENEDVAGGNPPLSPKKLKQMEKGKVKEEPHQPAEGFSAAADDDMEDVDAYFNSPGHLSPPEKVAREMRAKAKIQSAVEDVSGSGSSGGTSFNPLGRYHAYRDYDPNRFAVIHIPD